MASHPTIRIIWHAFLGAVLILACVVSMALAQPRIVFEIPGTDEGLRDALVSASLVQETRTDGIDRPAALLAAAQADYARLLGVLYDQGRFGGVISILVNGREAAGYSALAQLDSVREVRIRVAPGPLYRFGQAQVAPIATGTTLPETFANGAPASTSTILSAADRAVTGWRDIGHAKASIVDQSITARHAKAQVDARLNVNPGPLLTFGTVTVQGNSAVSTRRILKIAGLEEGRRFDPEEVERAANRLRRAGSFESVTIEEAENIGPNATLPLTIGVAEAAPRRFGFGAEVSTVDGLGLSGFWLHRNLLGGAERLRIDGEIEGLIGQTGGTDLSLGLRYERPASPATDTDLFAELTYEILDQPSFSSDTAEFTLGFTRFASDRTTVDLGAGFLNSNTEDEFGVETVTLFTLPFGGLHDRRDNELDATKGFYADLDITPFLALAGTSDGAQITFDGRAYTSTDRLTFAGRAQVGALVGPSIEDSPAFYRFFSGGGDSVRGQNFQSLGVEVGGVSTGGRRLLLLSGEVRASVADNIQLVGFIDWGTVGENSLPDFSGDSHAGAGIGLRYQTGIGPIRLDIAAPISGSTPADDFFIYVGIGQAF